MRSKNTLKNIIMAFIYEGILIVFGFIMPKLIIQVYGSAVNGLTSTINQLLQILNLLQAGAVGASIFQMYKPAAEEDYKQASIVLDSSRRYFTKIGAIFLLLIVICTPCIAFTKSGDGIASWEIALSCIILGINGSFYMFFTSWYDILFSSHQQRSLLSLAGIIEKLSYYGLLFVIIHFKLHFIFMYLAVFSGTIIKIVILYYMYVKKYKSKLVKIKGKNNFKINNRGYLLLNQMANQATDSMPTLVITAMYNLQFASVYAVYNLVQNMIKMIIGTLQHSVSEIFGNLVVSETEEKVSGVYNLLEFVFTICGIVLCTCSMFLFMPFIYTYTGGNSFDINYMFPALAVVIVLYDVFYCMFMPAYTLSNVYGLFKETYMQSVISAVLSYGIGFMLGTLYWPLIMLGPIFYYISSLIYRTYINFKRIPWLRLGKFIRRALVSVIMPVLAYFVSQSVYGEIYKLSWSLWFVQAIFCVAIVLAATSIYIFAFEREEFIGLLKYAKAIIKKKV